MYKNIKHKGGLLRNPVLRKKPGKSQNYVGARIDSS